MSKIIVPIDVITPTASSPGQYNETLAARYAAARNAGILGNPRPDHVTRIITVDVLVSQWLDPIEAISIGAAGGNVLGVEFFAKCEVANMDDAVPSELPNSAGATWSTWHAENETTQRYPADTGPLYFSTKRFGECLDSNALAVLDGAPGITILTAADYQAVQAEHTEL